MNTSRAALEKALAILNRERDYVVELTRTLVGFKSTNPVFTGDPEGSEESQVQTHIEQILREMQLEVTRWESCPRRPNVVGRLPGAGGRSLILNGHIDVVPIGDVNKWTVDPWGAEIKEGKLYGRGSFDMKGGVAAMITAARAIRQAGIDLGGELQIHSVVDEESGGMCGTRNVIAQGYRADAAIICEPSVGMVMPVEGGLEWVRVTIQGRTNHAGFRYSQIYPNRREGAEAVWINIGGSGVNALEKGVRFVQAVRELEREWAITKYHPVTPPGLNTINPGVMVAGVGRGPDGLPTVLSNPAIVPDLCVMEFDLKYLPHETEAGIRAEFEAFVSAFAQTDPWLREHPPLVEWGVRNISFPPINTPADHPLVTAVVAARREMGLETPITGFPAVTDGAFYAGAGVPSVIYGPMGAGAHGEDEYVVVDSLRETAAVYVHAILSYCGVA